LKKALLLCTVTVSILALIGCWKSASDQAEEHYEALRPVIEGATEVLDEMYAIDEQLGTGTITSHAAHNRVNQLKAEFLSLKGQLPSIKVPKDFEDEFQLVNNWMDQGEKTFDFMLVSIEKEAASIAEFDRALNDFYSAWDKETMMYDLMDEAYNKQMTEKGVELY